MKKLLKLVLNPIYTKYPNFFYFFYRAIRVDDLIPVTDSGSWKYRTPPDRSLRKTAKFFNNIKGNIIVEIGTGTHGRMSGNSIKTWAKKTNAKQIIAIDLDNERIKEVKKVSQIHPQIIPIHADGIEFLKHFSSKIDLLYLDFWVPDKEGVLNGTGRAEAYREAYLSAKEKMSDCSMILIDDSDHIDPWKQTYIIPMARKDGYKVIYVGRQTMLKRDFK